MKKLAAAAVTIVAGLTALAPAASADHNVPAVTVTEGACGEVTISTDWSTDTHTVDNAVLVVRTVNGQDTAPIGESLTVPPIDYASDTVRYRVWGGGERNYDSPALSDNQLAALVYYLETEGTTPLDLGIPEVPWHTLTVEGCVPGPEGPQGPAGEDGTDRAGTDGVAGSDGQDGTDGSDTVVDQATVAPPAVAVTGEPAFTG